MYKKNRRKFILSIAIIAGVFIIHSIFISLDCVVAADVTYTVPRLNVPLPGLNAEDFRVTKSFGALSIPFLSIFILTFYKYILGVGSVASAVIIIYGGFLYLLGSTGMRVESGKQKIVDAVVGLAILLGSYVILANVNANLVQTRSLDLTEIIRNEFIIADHSLHTEATAPSGIYADGPIVPDPEIQAIKPVVSGQCRAIMAIEKDKYIQNVSATYTGGDFGARIRQVAEIMADCGINMNNCGNVAQCAWMAAGINGEIKNGICKPIKGSFISVSSEIGGDAYTWAYGRRCESGEKCLAHARSAKDQKTAERWQSYFRSSDQCGKSSTEAIKLVRDHLRTTISDYPDKFTERLEPGDWVYVYAGNTECDGMHSMIFLGWHENKPGVAWIFDGSIKQNPTIRERCLANKGNCTGRYSPITRIMRPNFTKEGVSKFPN